MRTKVTLVDPHVFVTNPGSRIKTIFRPVYNGDHFHLEAIGTLDIQESINQYAPYTDIRYMLNRLGLGDRSVLSSKQPLYGDFSGLPSSPVEVLNLVEDCKQRFASFSDSVKVSCNNDWRQYFIKLCNGEFNSNSKEDSSDES